MPELPEVEVVRRGLETWVVGRRIESAQVLDARSVRRHGLGPEDFSGQLEGAVVLAAVRRGKFLWLPLADGSDGGAPSSQPPHTALMAHLGMSGQLLIEDSDQPDEKHLKVRLTLAEAHGLPPELRFVDQRIFGGLAVVPLVPTDDGGPGGSGAVLLPLIPREAAHIARDPLDPLFSVEAFHERLRARRTGLKRALLDQRLVSGIGNIYADEALWAARLHYARPTETLTRPQTARLVRAVVEVMERALDAGGTSFDSLYVNVNGASGYFDRSLAAYGQAGRACPRCAAEGRTSIIVRESFMNRSSYRCPHCQRAPRNARW
ncbi:bifunctional DNA-formamidopyrimidine glycosylase/DNA-(apurinic or apyrimidinic site) lyase [Sinomonas sp. JGH33]|uniref:Formamidopyrimidine-DNA glycosylase n=1 Tax=Sinomonas terricola TaxID=3110330 RepID=A0ABU5TA56_9MICC|nr:bifunctional DNA-formamidopyrimidine glycosylase/DNA-(apurinic or apyrimidinic site) lyase [Sinomonas sp. JGH33]MEA5456570.1 bifunctional DNA-formamidopyrimidine glycosylase/DNA-(apurinic or apyrimidinic site) lyase [Sinomonas sp. JGH33]